MSKSVLGIALVLVGLGMMGFLIFEALRAFRATPSVASVAAVNQVSSGPLAAASAISSTVGQPVNSGLRQAQDAYCLWPNDTLFDIAQYASADLKAMTVLNEDNPLFAGSTIYLPDGSLPPAQWRQPLPAITKLEELPFGVSGIYLGHDNRQKRVALTFDVGYVPENKALMEMLASRDIRATFFVVGFSVLRKPEIIQDIVSNGHELANHSWSHENLQGMNEEAVRYELNRTEQTVQKAYPGATTKPYFRAPFGALDETIINVAKQEGYAIIGWTVDSTDWTPGATAERVYQQVTRHVCPGAIIVMHDMTPIVAEALPRILDFLTNSGYQFVTLSELLLPPKTQ